MCISKKSGIKKGVVNIYVYIIATFIYVLLSDTVLLVIVLNTS